MALVLGAGGSAVSVQSSAYAHLRETINIVSRQVEDLSWVNLTTEDASRTLDDTYFDRASLIKRARLAAKRSPLARTALDLLQHYVLGQGVSIKAANRKLVAKIVDEFMEHPVNRSVLTSHQAMKEFLEATDTDGDYFLLLFPDMEQGTLQLGMIDAILVEDAIPDPENAKMAKWYKVRKPAGDYDFSQGTWSPALSGQEFVYYRHWQNEDPPPLGMGNKLQPGLVYQVSILKRGKFGRSGLYAAIDWLAAHREFMQDRATINKAAAAVAWKKKRKGPASDVAAEAARLRSSLVGNPQRYDTNPPRASGSTIVENEGTNLEWVKTDTGGGAADYDERKLRMMAGAGMGGIPIHYFGDEGNANLATATAMELPLLKAYEDWQKLLADTLHDLIDFALNVAHEAGRIGERDDSRKYADRVTTPQAVMAQPDVVAEPAGATPAPVREVMVLTLNEAGVPISVPYSPVGAGGVRMVPAPQAPPDPGAVEDNPSKPLDWYVDIDFPPIVQKDLGIYMAAVNTLSSLLPGENIESKKLVAELALQVFSVNDIDQAMERLYPPNMVAVLPPPAPPMLGPGQTKLLEDPVRTATAKLTGKGKLDKMAEGDVTSLAEVRRRRIIRAAEEAVDAYALVESG